MATPWTQFHRLNWINHGLLRITDALLYSRVHMDTGTATWLPWVMDRTVAHGIPFLSLAQ